MRMRRVGFALLLTVGVAALPVGARASLVQQGTGAAAESAGWLGVNLNIETILEGGVRSSRILVEDVVDGGGAARAGLASGDLLLTVNGIPASYEEMLRLTADLRTGDRVIVGVQRGQQRLTVPVVAGPRPAALPRVTARAPAPSPLERRMIVLSPRSSRQATWSALRGSPPSQAGVEGRDTARSERSVRIRTDDGNAVTIVFESTDSDREGGWTYAFSGPDAERTFVLHTPEVEALVSGIDALRLEVDDMMESQRPGQELPVSIWRFLGGRGWSQRDTRFEVAIERARSRMQEMERELASQAVARIGSFPDSVVTVAIGEQRPITPYAYLGRRYLAGAFLVALNPGMREYFGVSQGALVLDSVEGAPAEEAGLRPGDVIVAIDGRPVPDPDGLQVALADARPPYTLSVVRQGTRLQIILP